MAEKWRTLPSGTRIHVPHLRKLANFLRTPPPTQDMFDMSDFHSAAQTPTSRHTCGTVACAIGWSPAAGIRIRGDYSWVSYSTRTLIDDTKDNRFRIRDTEWDWCFGGAWAYVDNTPLGAALRIDWLLDHGLPENWKDQMGGDAPCCYKQPITI